MAQIPALFLPKQKTEEKIPEVKKSKVKQKRTTENNKKVSALLQRRINGNKKDASKTFGMGR